MPKIWLGKRRTRRGVGVASAALLLAGIPALAGVPGGSAVAAGGSTITVHTPSGSTSLGVFTRKDGQQYAAVRGTTSGSVLPTATQTDKPVPPPPTVTTDPTQPTPPALPAPTPTEVPAAYPTPSGSFTPGSPSDYAAPVDLTPYIGAPAHDPSTAIQIQVTDGTGNPASLSVPEANLYQQVVTNVRASKATIPGTSNITITARVTDQYGQPVVGAPLRIAGFAAGGPRIDQLAISDARGQVTFTGPSAGSTGGLPTGGYTVYGDLNVNDNAGPNEVRYQVIQGIVSFSAPGHSLYHNDKRIKNAGGVYADAAKGSKAAHARHFQWIDQDGQLAFRSKGQKAAGAARISQASDLVWVNAHGAPFNPKWLKKGRFETKTWNAIKKHPGIRDAAATLRQDAALGLNVEWEVKDVKPFNKAATLDAAFTNLATAAQQYYGAGWASRVEIKVLSNLKGGQSYALKVLKHAHAHGFTTIYLARGRATGMQIPASAQTYVTYVRGAAGGVFPAIPSPAQDAPVVVTSPRRS